MPKQFRVSSLHSTLLYTLLVGVMPLLVSSSLSYGVIRYEAVIQVFTWQIWVLIYALACLTMAFALTPTTFIALLSGYFLGWGSFVPLAISYWLASVLGFVIAQSIDHGRLYQYLQSKPKVQAFIQQVHHNEFNLILLARLSPVLPFALTNVLFAMLKTRWRNFLTAGFLGMVPRTLLSIWAGTQARELRKLIENPHQANSIQWLIAGLVLVSLFGIYEILRKAKKRF